VAVDGVHLRVSAALCRCSSYASPTSIARYPVHLQQCSVVLCLPLPRRRLHPSWPDSGSHSSCLGCQIEIHLEPLLSVGSTPQSRWRLLTGEGCARRLMKRSSRGNRTGGRWRSHWVCAPMDAESPPLTRQRLPLPRVSTALLTSSRTSSPVLDLRVLLHSAEVRSVSSIAARQRRRWQLRYRTAERRSQPLHRKQTARADFVFATRHVLVRILPSAHRASPLVSESTAGG
jgi:hypothetical protein